MTDMRRIWIGLLLSFATVMAGNWPQWRGPSLDGVSDEKGLPEKWTTEENVTWKLALPGRSGATPIIWGEHIFLNVAEGDDLQLWALDRAAGAVKWKKKLAGGNYKINKIREI